MEDGDGQSLRIDKAASIEEMKAYLRRVDLVGGYIPQLVMPRLQSDLWTLFWFAVRRIDELIDNAGLENVRPLIDGTRHGEGNIDFQRAMRAFVNGASAYMDSRRRMIEMLDYAEAEHNYLKFGASNSAESLFTLFYHKAYIPAYVGMRLLLGGEDEERVKKYAKLVGTGFQFADDLIDFLDDLEDGLFWVTGEELKALGIDRSLCLSRIGSLTSLREKICLTYFLRAYDLASRFTSHRNRRLAELTIEQFFRCVEKGRFHVYPRPWKNYYGFLGVVLPPLPGPEWLKYAFLHQSFDAFRRSTIAISSLQKIRNLVENSHLSCPPMLSPDVCLDLMTRCEARWEDRNLESLTSSC